MKRKNPILVYPLSKIVDEEISKTLQEVKNIAHSFLELEDDSFIDVALATVVGNKFDSDPIWIFIKGPPSSVKTELLRAMDGHESVVFISSLTANTLASGYNPDGKNKKKDYSLLPELTGKVMVVKDFTTVLQLRQETRSEIFAQLREIFDGMYDKYFGTGQRIQWRGKMGFLSAVTHAIEKHTSVNQTLGERFLFLCIRNPNPMAIAKRAQENTLGEKARRTKLKKVVHKFLDIFKGKTLNKNIKVTKSVENKLSSLAVFCALSRTSVDRDRYTKNVTTQPVPEGPGRLVKQFRLLGISLATVRGIDCIDEKVYKIVRKIARDSIPSIRLKIIKTMYEIFRESADFISSTREISTRTKIPFSTVKYQLEDLRTLELVELEIIGTGKTAAYMWALSDDFIKCINDSDVFA
ncbi:hypothetical protein ACFL6P_03250 [Candidatus Latescibacterota bacterium]